MQFVLNNWALFLALAVVLYLLIAPPLRQFIYGVRNVSPNQTVQLINRQQAVVVDLRESSEFQAGHIPAAINLPFIQLATRVAELEKFKDKPMVLYCALGQRSARAGVVLRRRGFDSVYSLAGGVNAWRGQNLPLET